MPSFRPVAVWSVVAGFVFATFAAADDKLERGQDRIDVPAISPGLCLHNLFQSGMVLQRDKPIRVWGWAEPGEAVTVSFGDQSATATAAADRSWAVSLKARPANSQPLRLVAKGREKTIERDNILVGDLWLLGGQSNMEFEIDKVDGGDLEIASANFPLIRLFTVPHQNGPDAKASFPLQYQWSDWFGTHFRQGYWDVCTPKTVREMSAIGYVFARRVHLATKVPIGLVDASRGGTTLETWTPLAVLKSVDTPQVKTLLAEWDQKVAAYDSEKDLRDRVKAHTDRMARFKAEGRPVPANTAAPTDHRPGPAMDANRPGTCYASMIAPIAGFPIKGALWHQGYNNALQPNGHAMYRHVFPKTIAAWRAAFDDPAMPFGIISQETEGDPQDPSDFLEKMADEGTYIREAHYQTFLDLRKAGDVNVGYASTFDLRRSWYHPQIKIPAGERMARWALATQYGFAKAVRWLPPMLKDVRAEGKTLVLRLDSPAGPYHDGPIEGFAVAGADHRFQPAKAEWGTTAKGERNPPQQDRTAIVLTSPLVPEPKYFRHAWARNPMANLKSMDHTDLPFPTMRNDTLTLADLYEVYAGKKTATPNELDRREREALVKALRAEDLKRRVAEAEALLKGRDR